MAYWTTSGGFVFVTILAGAGSVAAAFVGSLAFEAVRSFAFDVMPQLWQMTLGSVLLLTILFLPEGLGSMLSRLQAGRGDEGIMSTSKSDNAILAVHDLEKTFGSLVAARDITVSVPAEQTVGVIGANGAGKTTFINMITGHLTPTKGSIWFEGKEITGMPSREITRLGISRSFQVAQIFPSLTVFENMCIAAAIARRAGGVFGNMIDAGAFGCRRRRSGGDHRVVPGRRLLRHAREATCHRACASCSTSAWPWSAGRACCCWMNQPAASRSKRNLI